MKILADASISGLHLAFPPPFELSLYNTTAEVEAKLEDAEILVCRSTLKVDETLLKKTSLRFVATATSGTDHIDSTFLQEHDIIQLDAKGCNATSVADYVLSCIAYLKLYHNFSAKTAGIVGCGAVGGEVIKRLNKLGFDIKQYDPYLPLPFSSCAFDDILACDIICVHPNLHNTLPYPSHNLFDTAALKRISPSSVVINASRGGIVNEHALLKHHDFFYCTDVYQNEPRINPEIVELATICTPHIAGHSIEAKQNALEIISNKLHQAYNLPRAFFPPIPSRLITLDLYKNWQELVLHLYNPAVETLNLKNSFDKTLAFQTIRKEHQYRYNFSSYKSSVNNVAIIELIR